MLLCAEPHCEHLGNKIPDATSCICVEGSKALISQAGSSTLSQGAERCGSCSGTGKVMCIACLCTGKSLPEGFSHAIPQDPILLSILRGCQCPCQAKTACHLQGRRLPGSMTFGSILSSENGMRTPRISLHLHLELVQQRPDFGLRHASHSLAAAASRYT